MTSSNSTPTPFNIETAPLTGTYLLEANAGTGKTFSLSGLFLKFLYFDESLSIKNLVAITFTKSATQEIFTRIKSDLEHFINLIHTYTHLPSEDKLEIDKLSFAYLFRNYYSDLSPSQQKIKREHLSKCLLNFDEHNINTIHGFAGKVISEYRFELGLTIGEKITQDDSPSFEEAFQEFWRHHFLDVDPYFLAYFESNYPKKKWHDVLQTLYQRPTLKLYPPLFDSGKDTEKHQENKETSLQAWKQSSIKDIEGMGGTSEYYKKLQQLWKNLPEKIPQDIESHWAKFVEEKPALHSGKTKTLLPKWIGLESLIREERLIPFLYEVFKNPDLTTRFTTEKIESLFNKNHHPQDYLNQEILTVIGLIDELHQIITDLSNKFKKNSILLIHASNDYIKEKSMELRVKQGVMSFNDLLVILAHHINSPRGEHLIQQLSQTFRVILIDEFQDTDPLQFTIFQHLLPKVQAVYFIADPKQSIYSFRQANIHTYLKAKQSIETNFQLLNNYRSDPLLLQGVNYLYKRHPVPFLIPELKYHPSESGLSGEVDPKEQDSPLKIIFSESEENIGKKRQDIAHLLIQNIREVIGQGDRIAILVRKRAHGFFLHNQLRSAGIPSVVDDTDNPFQTQEARDLYLLIKVVLFCGENTSKPITTYRDSRLLGALSTSFFLEKKIIETSPYSEDELQDWLVIFQDTHRKWEEQGWYFMIHELIKEAGIASRLLSQEDGDQRYRRLLLLIDVVHSWEDKYPEQILSHFSSWLADEKSPDTSEVSASTELASDDMVKITTIHKSKGLEYDIVFLPFFDENLFPKSVDVIFKLESDNPSDKNDIGFLAYDLGSVQYEEHKALSKQEVVAEQLRVLYVALTRAKKSCYLYISLHEKHYPKSTLRYLLHPPAYPSPEASQGQDDQSNSNLFWEDFQATLTKSAFKKSTLNKDKQSFEEKISSWKQELVSLGNHPSISFHDVSSQLGDDIPTPIQSPVDELSPSQSIQPTQQVQPFQPFQPSQGKIYSEGFQTSFSAMTADLPHKTNSLNELNEEQIDDLAHETEPPSSEAVIDDPLSSFPPGASVGLFLHEVLENMDFSNPDPNYLKSILSLPAQKYLSTYLKNQAIGTRKETTATLIKMLQSIQNLELNFPDAPLILNHVFSESAESGINGKAVRELEFTLSFSDTEDNLRERIFSLLQESGLITKFETNTNNDTKIIFRNGLIKGFIDLVFRYGEQYYLLDWKSNHLGNEIANYNEANLHRAMIENNYYLQGYIYTLALDRYLALRLQEDYDYEKHFGGFAYIFVRGIYQEGALIHKPSSEAITEMRKLL